MIELNSFVLESPVNRKTKRIIKQLLCAAMLPMAGCAIKYQLPPGAETAKIRFLTTDWTVKRVEIFANADCDRGPFGGQIGHVGGWGSNGEANRLNMYDSPPQDIKIIEREVPAGGPLYFSFVEANYLYSCNVTLTFTTQKGRQYEAVQSTASHKCSVKMYELVQLPDDSIARMPVVARQEKQCSYSF